jgi:hypothetical protein
VRVVELMGVGFSLSGSEDISMSWVSSIESVGFGGTGRSAVERVLWTGGVGDFDVDLRVFAICDVLVDGDMV